MMEMNEVLQECITRGGSDIHISVGRPVTLRLHGELVNLTKEKLAGPDSEALMKAITSDQNRQKVEEVGGVDFGFAYGDKARFRVSAFKQKGCYGLVLRMIPNDLFTFEQIGIPSNIIDIL